MENECQEKLFKNDTVRQLKAGMKCYVFKESQIEEIRKKYKDKTGLDFEVEQEEDYFILIPKKKVILRY